MKLEMRRIKRMWKMHGGSMSLKRWVRTQLAIAASEPTLCSAAEMVSWLSRKAAL